MIEKVGARIFLSICQNLLEDELVGLRPLVFLFRKSEPLGFDRAQLFRFLENSE